MDIPLGHEQIPQVEVDETWDTSSGPTAVTRSPRRAVKPGHMIIKSLKPRSKLGTGVGFVILTDFRWGLGLLSQWRSLKLSDILIPIDLMPSFGSSWWWVIHIYTRVSTLVIEEASFQSLFSKPIERGDDVLGLQDSGFWTHRYITSVRSV